MVSIDAVIKSLPILTETKRAVWAANAIRVIAHGPHSDPAYANALRLRDAIATFEATRPAEEDLITACALDWDRTAKDRTSFRSFDGDRLAARVTRIKPGKFVVQVHGATLPQLFTTLSAARAAAAGAVQAGADDALADFPWAA